MTDYTRLRQAVLKHLDATTCYHPKEEDAELCDVAECSYCELARVARETAGCTEGDTDDEPIVFDPVAIEARALVEKFHRGELDGTYRPDVVFPPGETIRELMAEWETPTDVMRSILSDVGSDLDKLLSGEARVDAFVAGALEGLFDVPAQVWLNLDAAYVRWIESNPTHGPSQNSAE